MDAELKAKWVAALRSGEYAQGQNWLRRKPVEGPDEFCCLGVLCNLVDQTGWGDMRVSRRTIEFRDGAECWAPVFVETVAALDHSASVKLAGMNDDGRTFAEIADYIDANL